jgi:hypothetical protein
MVLFYAEVWAFTRSATAFGVIFRQAGSSQGHDLRIVLTGAITAELLQVGLLSN